MLPGALIREKRMFPDLASILPLGEASSSILHSHWDLLLIPSLTSSILNKSGRLISSAPHGPSLLRRMGTQKFFLHCEQSLYLWSQDEEATFAYTTPENILMGFQIMWFVSIALNKFFLITLIGGISDNCGRRSLPALLSTWVDQLSTSLIPSEVLTKCLKPYWWFDLSPEAIFYFDNLFLAGGPEMRNCFIL